MLQVRGPCILCVENHIERDAAQREPAYIARATPHRLCETCTSKCVGGAQGEATLPMLPSYHPSQGKATLSAAELLSCFVLPGASEHEAGAAGFHVEGSCAHELFRELISDDLAFDEARAAQAPRAPCQHPASRAARATHATHAARALLSFSARTRPRAHACHAPRARATRCRGRCAPSRPTVPLQPQPPDACCPVLRHRRAVGGSSSGARRCARCHRPGSRIRSGSSCAASGSSAAPPCLSTVTLAPAIQYAYAYVYVCPVGPPKRWCGGSDCQTRALAARHTRLKRAGARPATEGRPPLSANRYQGVDESTLPETHTCTHELSPRMVTEEPCCETIGLGGLSFAASPLRRLPAAHANSTTPPTPRRAAELVYRLASAQAPARLPLS